MAGKTIRLFLVDGTANSLITAELMNWTGHILVTSRSSLGQALGREEADRTGIYVLSGQDPERPSQTRIYIGEGDNVGARLRMHARDENKDFWTKACVITSKDANLTKAHVRHLEHRLVQLALTANRASVANGNEPREKLLPEADLSDMEVFIANLQAILPAVGFDFFQVRANPAVLPTGSFDARSEPSNVTELRLTHRSGIEATAIEVGGDIIVQKGSSVQPPTDYATNQYADLRDQLFKDGVIDGDEMRFTKDYKFSSPSAAAAVIIGRNANGRRNWKLPSGESLKDWQDRQLD
ncbi:GIY-YIG nuclease family protein [Qipengyuania flava]|uniref:GIY-YIG nuclease family protein n=1 Tax=Qipengyuania flava TaxID=192812 RepID=UPI001C5871C4|nr:GIY-YIG nuclease family protein [Qipengyuania flava]MBW3167072.1 GIY-YIG nuclease family protein [Qipengyuania flava]MBY5964310.1 GIY-YIG nuclease family protein [Qipengyuania flava]MBY6010634.1 GIY-YIG nuclease family protein [Qipengyuania flava]MBY6025076.1 GIY-YIG nuclease family protein [Qipengyuania flava]